MPVLRHSLTHPQTLLSLAIIIPVCSLFLTRVLSFSRLSSLGVVVLLLNYKSLPFTWHIRLITAILRQTSFWWLKKFHLAHLHTKPFVVITPSNLWQFAVMECSRSVWLEGDYNLHKSNSTYFSDADMARTFLVSRIFARAFSNKFEDVLPRSVSSSTLSSKAAGVSAASTPIPTPSTGISGASTPVGLTSPLAAPPLIASPIVDNVPVRNSNGKPGQPIYTALGNVSCDFRREIPLFAPFDTYTRVLCWDHKWIYIITHFLLRDKVQVDGCSLQPWKRFSGKHDVKKQWEEEGALTKRVMATSLARYVFKKGRLTIPPPKVMEVSGLFPSTAANDGTNQPTSAFSEEEVKKMMNDVEEERQHGLAVANQGWDALHSEFERGMRLSKGRVLGIWGDVGLW